MGRELQFRRGLEQNRPVLLEGEPGYNTDTKTLNIGDTVFKNKAQLEKEISDLSLDKTNQLDTLETKVSNKILLDGASKNLELKEKQIIQKGLIAYLKYGETLSINPTTINDYSIILNFKTNSISTTHQSLIYSNIAPHGAFNMFCNAVGNVFFKPNGAESQIYFSPHGFKKNEYFEVRIECIKGKMTSMYVDGKFINSSAYNFDMPAQLSALQLPVSNNYEIEWCTIYDRILSPEEIKHNFNVLNNESSIDALTFTDTDNTNPQEYKISSYSSISTMQNGFNIESAYEGLLKAHAKEFVCDSNGVINIDNAINNSNLLGLEIGGRTVKNISMCEKFSIKSIDGNPSAATVHKYNYLPCIKNEQTYTLFCYISKNTLPSGHTDSGLRVLRQETFGAVHFIDGGVTGLIKRNFVARSATSNGAINWNDGTTNFYVFPKSNITEQWEIVVDWSIIVEGDGSEVCDCDLPSGLSSSQATISNNGLDYKVYDPLTNKAIKLNQVSDICDTLKVLSDGSAIWTQKFKHFSAKDFNYESNAMHDINAYGHLFRLSPITSLPIKECASGICDITNFTNRWDTEGFTTGYLNYLYFMVDKTKAGITTDDTMQAATQKAVAWFNDNIKNNGNVFIELATPVITYIPKEYIEEVFINTSNRIEAGDAIKASTFKITAPVDRLSEQEAEINTLLAQQANLSALATQKSID